MIPVSADMKNFLTLIPPGKSVIEAGSVELWKAVEKAIGFAMPAELLHLSLNYGSGVFVDGGFSISIHNPFKPLFPTIIEYNRGIMNQVRAKDLPPIFELGGWSLEGDEQGDEGHIWWEREGSPETWPIYVRAGLTPMQRFDMPLSTFLLKAFRNEISVHHFPVFRELRFVPSERKYRPPCCFCSGPIYNEDTEYVTLLLRLPTGVTHELWAHGRCLESATSPKIAVPLPAGTDSCG